MSTFTINHSNIATFGVGSSALAGKKVKEMGCKQVVFIYDPVMEKLGHAKKIKDLLTAEGIEYVEYSGVTSEPTFNMIEDAAAVARKFNADGVVALGGGSSMDTAKGVGLMLKEKESKIQDFVGMNALKPHNQSCPVLLLPTTAGTSAEVTPGYAVTDPELNIKTGGLKYGNRALVDPEFTVNLPASITAQTGIDLLSHVTESITNPAVDWMSDLISEKVIELVFKYLPLAVKDGSNLEVRTQLSYACLIAGYAFSNKGTHVGHTIADMISSIYHYPHGVGCSIGLPITVRYAAKKCPEKLEVIARAIGLKDLSAEAVFKAYKDLLKEIGMKDMKELGIDRTVVDRIAENLPKGPRFAPGAGLDAQTAINMVYEEFNS